VSILYTKLISRIIIFIAINQSILYLLDYYFYIDIYSCYTFGIIESFWFLPFFFYHLLFILLICFARNRTAIQYNYKTTAMPIVRVPEILLKSKKKNHRVRRWTNYDTFQVYNNNNCSKTVLWYYHSSSERPPR